MQPGIVATCALLAVLAVFTVSAPVAEAAPYRQDYWNQLDEEDPEALMEIIARLGHTIMRYPELENTKRGVDLGVHRGYSGLQASKHLIGLATANDAGGPGRRRRSEQP